MQEQLNIEELLKVGIGGQSSPDTNEQTIMSDLCPCGILKSKCTHPNCSDAECPACNQTPCQCNDECESCGA